jgi:hypothetical protein
VGRERAGGDGPISRSPAEADLKVLQFARRMVFAMTMLVACPVLAADWYVAPTGSDTNPGSMTAPFATVGRGQTAAAAGDTIFIRGGVYTIAGTSATVGIAFTKSGLADRRINYFAYPGETPIFDLFGLLPQARVTGLDVNCSWIHIRGLEVRGVQQIVVGDSWGARVRGNNNILEHLNVHHGEAPGIFIASGANNLILNCDSHHNYDPLEGGGNGDGFGCHSTGGGNVISGCRSYSNSDDGYDFINATGTCTVEKSWSFNNGYIPDTTMASGNGAGFKAGGYGTDVASFPPMVPRHTVRQCVAFGNRSQGFYANHHPGGIDFFNNTAFRNPVNFNMLADLRPSDHKLRNNIAMAPGTAINNLTGGTDTFNSWTLPVTVSAADFLSAAEAEALAPRADDGSLPAVNFMRLAANSDLIDKGEDVSLPFAGTAPDLGAFETGLVTGAGGTTGTIGSGGAGGRQAGTGGRGVGGATAPGGATGTGAGTASSGGMGGGRGISTGGTASSTGGNLGGGGGAKNAGDVSTGCGCSVRGSVPGRHEGPPTAEWLSLSVVAALLRGRRVRARSG